MRVYNLGLWGVFCGGPCQPFAPINQEGENCGAGNPLLPFQYRPFRSKINCLAKKGRNSNLGRVLLPHQISA